MKSRIRDSFGWWVKIVLLVLLALVAIFGGKDAVKGFRESVLDALKGKELALREKQADALRTAFPNAEIVSEPAE